MKMMIQRTKVRFESAPTVFIMIVRMSFRDFHDLASLNTLVEDGGWRMEDGGWRMEDVT